MRWLRTLLQKAPAALARGMCTRLARALAGLAVALIPVAAHTAERFIPYTPTPQAVVDRMVELAQVTERDYVIDLGCGDGRILVTAAKRYGARGLGVDIDAQRIVEANANAQQEGVADKVTFRRENLFDTDISKASVLALYLGLAVDIKLRPRILDTMKPGARLLSHQFNMGDWLPDHTEPVEGHTLYMWLVPAKVGGTWRVADDSGGGGNGGFALTLTQQFQMLEGTATVDGKALPVLDGRVDGEQVRFVLDRGDGDRRAYEGRLVDGRLVGKHWTAMRR